MVNCPQCNGGIDVDEDELDEGDSLICEECGANLNVTGVSPLELSADDEDDFDEDVVEEERPRASSRRRKTVSSRSVKSVASSFTFAT